MVPFGEQTFQPLPVEGGRDVTLIASPLSSFAAVPSNDTKSARTTERTTELTTIHDNGMSAVGQERVAEGQKVQTILAQIDT